MSAPIFNKPDDRYIFTGSQFRAGIDVSNLRLSKGLTSVIDISQTGIDICANNVFINSANLRVGSLTLATGATLNVPGTLTFGELSGGSGTFTSTLGVNGLLSGTSGRFSSNLDVSGELTVVEKATYNNGLVITGPTAPGRTSLVATSGTFSTTLGVSGLLSGTSGTFSNGLSVTGGDLNVTNNLTLDGNLTVRGTTTTINSSIVDISDKNITLAAGNTSRSQALGAGFDICGTNATFRYDFTSNTSVERFVSSVGLSVSGNILPNNTNSVLPVSYNSFKVKSNRDNRFSSYLGISGSIEILLEDYTTGINLISLRSYVKVDIRLNYIASKEASQTLTFRVTRLLYTLFDSFEENTISTETIGSDMGVGLKGAYVASIIDLPLNGRVMYTGVFVTYRVYMTRNVLSDDTISEEIGVVAAPLWSANTNNAVSNYVLLQELYVPP
jgi:hypothetical protein